MKKTIMKNRKKGFSMVELIMTLFILALMITVVFQIFVTVNANMFHTYNKMVCYDDSKNGGIALWDSSSAGDPSVYTANTTYSKNDDFFNSLKDEGISESVISDLQNSMEFWKLTYQNNNREFLSVRPLSPWH